MNLMALLFNKNTLRTIGDFLDRCGIVNLNEFTVFGHNFGYQSSFSDPSQYKIQKECYIITLALTTVPGWTRMGFWNPKAGPGARKE